jgi:hypothetical protein
LTNIEILHAGDLDVAVTLPDELRRVVAQGLVDLTPWHIMSRESALKCIQGLRLRYPSLYVPFARRQDNDDLACLDPEYPGQVILVHDFASAGFERRANFANFWEWFRSAVDDMIFFD